jgi:hypothetical protein
VVPKNRFPKKEKVVNGPGPEKNLKSRKSWLKNEKSEKKPEKSPEISRLCPLFHHE